MIELQSLTFNNIGRFTQEQTIDFTNRDKLIQIDGKNNNTGGSSGAAKSTIIDALMYLFDIANKPATVLQSRLTKSAMCVTGEFKVNNQLVTIKRHRKDGLTIITPEETLSGNSEITERKLDELIGIPRKLFKKMIHKPQKQDYFFINMTGMEIYKFLITVLGLEKYLTKMEDISTDIKTKTELKDKLKIELDSINNSIEEVNGLIASQGVRPVCTANQTEIDMLINSRLILQNTLKTLNEQTTAEITALIVPIKQKFNFDSTLLNSFKQQLSVVQAQKTEFLNTVNSKKTVINDKIREQQILLANIANEKAQAKNILNNQISANKVKLNNIISERSAKVAATKALITANKSELDNITRARAKAQELGLKIQEQNAEKAEIEKAICPTCEQTWIGEKATAKIEQIKLSIAEIIKQALALKDVIAKESFLNGEASRLAQELSIAENYVGNSAEINANIARINKELLDIDFDVSKLNLINSEINKLQQELKQVDMNTAPLLEFNKQIEEISTNIIKEQSKELNLDTEAENIYVTQKNEYLSKTQAIQAKFKAEVDNTTNQINSVSNNINALQAQLTSFTQVIKQWENESNRLNALLKTKQDSILTTQTKFDETEKQILIADEAKRLIKTYTLQIFQETLDSVGEMATNILNSIPNVGTCTIYFEAVKENKDGTFKDEVTPIINMDGEDGIPLKSLCGGEGSGFGLAIDLAVIDIIESKSGKGANFYFIDEGFDGQDGVCRARALEILQQVDTNKTIIIIDHCDELKAMVKDVITVVRNGDTSVVEEGV